MREHLAAPAPDVSAHQVLMSFGNLALAYAAAIVVPDLQRQHSEPSRMPRVILLSLLLVSGFFLALAVTGYVAGGCQLSGNILFSIASPSDPLAASTLEFTAARGAVIMAYLFMQMHITIAFSTLLQPAFYMAERLVLAAVSIALRDHFLDLVDFTGATFITVGCLIVPLVLYLKVLWRKLPLWERGLALTIIVICAAVGVYVMIYAGKNLLKPADSAVTFPYCSDAYQNESDFDAQH